MKFPNGSLTEIPFAGECESPHTSVNVLRILSCLRALSSVTVVICGAGVAGCVKVGSGCGVLQESSLERWVRSDR